MKMYKSLFEDSKEMDDYFMMGFVVKELIRKVGYSKMLEELDITFNEAMSYLEYYLRKVAKSTKETVFEQKLKNMRSDITQLKRELKEMYDKMTFNNKAEWVIKDMVVKVDGKVYYRLPPRFWQDIFDKRHYLRKTTKVFVEKVWEMNTAHMISDAY